MPVSCLDLFIFVNLVMYFSLEYLDIINLILSVGILSVSPDIWHFRKLLVQREFFVLWHEAISNDPCAFSSFPVY